MSEENSTLEAIKELVAALDADYKASELDTREYKLIVGKASEEFTNSLSSAALLLTKEKLPNEGYDPSKIRCFTGICQWPPKPVVREGNVVVGTRHTHDVGRSDGRQSRRRPAGARPPVQGVVVAHAWLIGENNPYSEDPYFALYPRPVTASGYRLCAKILGMHAATYLDAFERRNLLSRPRWSMPAARGAAEILQVASASSPLILCGAKVAAAFGLPTKPFEVHHLDSRKVVVIPHPSGLSRAWNEPGAFARARAVIKEAVPSLGDFLGEFNG